MLVEEIIERSKRDLTLEETRELLDDLIYLLTPHHIGDLVDYVESENTHFEFIETYSDLDIEKEAEGRELEIGNEVDLSDFTLQEIRDHLEYHYDMSVTKSNESLDNDLYFAIMATDPDSAKSEIEKLVMKHLGIYR